MQVNWNEIANEVASLEGGKVNLPIAQVKEVLRCFRIVLWRRLGTSAIAWMGFIYDLAARACTEGRKWSDDNDSN